MVTALQESMEKIQSQAKRNAERINSAEQRTSTLEDTITSLKETQKKKNRIIENITAKLDDLENRSRHNNLRIVGLPERVEGRDTTSFVQKLLADLLNNELDPVGERAHRSLRPKLGPNEKSRTIILKMLKSLDKEKLVIAARKKGQLEYRGQKFYIFQDFLADLLRRRAEYNDLWSKLQTAQIQYGILYPAKLRIMYEGQKNVFGSPGEAEKELRKLIPKIFEATKP
nr:PREDICTED: uncharacterized protein LOC106705277 [Latimeria chalumnae]|eukprot:XP_014349720.1 PREDICTED: uncharacterized protein LOC106705277 [Latimeria chalumnae]